MNTFICQCESHFIVYADFEAFTKPIDTCQSDPKKSFTMPYQKHIPSSFCYYIKCFDDEIYKKDPVIYTAEREEDDVAQIFIDKLEEDVKDIFNRINKPMIFTEEDKNDFEKSTVCYICGDELGADRVRDHCHLTGKFRGAAHSECNLKYRTPNFIPVVFHNLCNYDTHLFIKKLRGKISCIPNNEEKYISFSKNLHVYSYTKKDGENVDVFKKIRFIDSFKFMTSSLDVLSKNLNGKQCKNLKKFYRGKHFDLLKRKGVYPYDYVDSVDKLSETSLPPKDAFYSRLNDEAITDEDYEHVKNVWKEFNIKSLRKYHNLYNISDVLLLADVFENFRDVLLFIIKSYT